MLDTIIIRHLLKVNQRYKLTNIRDLITSILNFELWMNEFVLLKDCVIIISTYTARVTQQKLAIPDFINLSYDKF